MGQAKDEEDFRLVLFVDGRVEPIEVAVPGPGYGFSLFIHQRDGCCAIDSFEIIGYDEGPALITEVKNRNGLLVAKSVTSR